MKDGVHIPASLVRVAVLGLVIGLAVLVKAQLPEAARYLKMERM